MLMKFASADYKFAVKHACGIATKLVSMIETWELLNSTNLTFRSFHQHKTTQNTNIMKYSFAIGI